MNFVREDAGRWLSATLAVVVLPALFALMLPSQSTAAEKGVDAQLTWGDSTANQDREAATYPDLGVKWVRLSATWNTAEPSKGSYSSWWLNNLDASVQRSRNAGAQIVLVVYGSPAWAATSGSGEGATPKNPADFANFMAFLANRYKGRIAGYEVWNEENYDRFWQPGPNAGAYTALLKATYPAIKAADPNAKVVFGGTSTSDYPFIEQAYAAGAKGYFDVMGVHPYTCSSAPESIRYSGGRITKDSFAGYREIRASMLARGDDKPIWATEFGWTSATAGYCLAGGEATQADYLTRSFKVLESDPYVEVALWYNIRNDYWGNDANNWEDQMGLMRSGFSHKPAYDAFKAYNPPGGSSTPPPPPPPPPPSGDTTAPSVSFKAPTNGQTVAGTLANATCEVNATDNTGVSEVDFYLDGSSLNVEHSSPWNCVLDTTTITNGNHTLKATARDAAGNSASATVVINIQNTGSPPPPPPGDTTAPSVSFKAPTNGQTVAGTLANATCEVNATDNTGVSEVDFYLDGSSLNVEHSSPWNCVLDTTTITNGNHTLKATARDAAGNSSNASITISVENSALPPITPPPTSPEGTPPPVNAAPSVELTAPADGSNFNGSLALAANASDDVGVDRVEFWVDTTLVKTDTTAPYSYKWMASKKISYGAHTVRATAFDAGGATASDSVDVTRSKTTKTSVTVKASRAHSRTLTGRVRGGVKRGVVELLLQREDPQSGDWQTVSTFKARLSRSGRFVIRTPVGRGHWRVRAVFPGTERYGASESNYRTFGI